ncbi:hypothetical protein [Clostridium vincentii]|nr:hypothetical protein [Clostridium vincentii]
MVLLEKEKYNRKLCGNIISTRRWWYKQKLIVDNCIIKTKLGDAICSGF